jgi:hypothetical protein
MLGLDVVIWAILAWYLDKLFPGMGRPGLKPLFFLDKNYWSVSSLELNGSHGITHVVPAADGNVESRLSNVSENMEAVDLTGIPLDSQNAIRILGVRKEFPVIGGKKKSLFSKKQNESKNVKSDVKVAVENVSLDLHAGQTLALLG